MAFFVNKAVLATNSLGGSTFQEHKGWAHQPLHICFLWFHYFSKGSRNRKHTAVKLVFYVTKLTLVELQLVPRHHQLQSLHYSALFQRRWQSRLSNMVAQPLTVFLGSVLLPLPFSPYHFIALCSHSLPQDISSFSLQNVSKNFIWFPQVLPMPNFYHPYTPPELLLSSLPFNDSSPIHLSVS